MNKFTFTLISVWKEVRFRSSLIGYKLLIEKLYLNI
jgi:hypothetical protein